MILYFTGTDNSLFIAKRIAEQTKDSLLSINDRVKTNDTSEIDVVGNLIFVVPTYAWRIPRVVEEWINHTAFIGAQKVYFILSCGDSIGNADQYIRKLCHRKSFPYMGVMGIIMPENYIALYEAPEVEVAKQIIAKAIPVIDAASDLIKQGNLFPNISCSVHSRLNSSIVNPVFYRFVVKAKPFTVDDRCIGCGQCVKECPLNNIRLSNKKPVWSSNCTHCMACICKCPTHAIDYGKNSAHKVRYRCPM